MNPLDDAEMRASFVNCSKGEISKINIPMSYDINWVDLDFLGWRDPKAPGRGYLVVPWDGRLVGVALRAASKRSSGPLRSSMCSICLTVHAASGVTLFTAPLAGSAGRNGNSIGNYMCANLQCSRYLRGQLSSDALIVPAESLDQDARIDRMLTKLHPFIARILNA